MLPGRSPSLVFHGQVGVGIGHQDEVEGLRRAALVDQFDLDARAEGDDGRPGRFGAALLFDLGRSVMGVYTPAWCCVHPARRSHAIIPGMLSSVKRGSGPQPAPAGGLQRRLQLGQRPVAQFHRKASHAAQSVSKVSGLLCDSRVY